MKNRWTKIVCVVLMGLLCVSMAACQASKKTTDDSLNVEKDTNKVEGNEPDAEDTGVDLIEGNTAADYEESTGAEETEQDETVTESFSEMEDESIEDY